MFNPQLKNKPERDKKYLKAICENGCCVQGCFNPAIPHHLKNHKLGGMKVSDFLTMPLCDQHHSAGYETGIHNNFDRWENRHGTQTSHIIITLQQSAINGFITVAKANRYIKICEDLNNKRG